MNSVQRTRLIALQTRYRQLLTMLPTGVNELGELGAAQFSAKLADVELIASELLSINRDMWMILGELGV